MTFSVNEHRLYRDGQPVEHRTTTKMNRGTMKPKVLVIHYTGSENFGSDVHTLTDSDRKASAQLVLAPNGDLVQIEDFTTKLWHAGTSEWKGRKSLNGWSIGIEVTCIGWLNDKGDDGRWRRKEWDEKKNEWRYTRWFDQEDVQITEGPHPNNPNGEVLGWPMFTPQQMAVLEELVPALCAEYGLEVVGHDDIAPKRKVDPGLCIDRRWFNIWNGDRHDIPVPDAVTPAKDRLLRQGDSGPDVERVQIALRELDYPVGGIDGIFGRKTNRAVIRFQKAWLLSPDGVVGPATRAKLFPN